MDADAPASEIAAHLKKFTEGLKAGITSAEMSFEHTGEQGLAYEGKDVSGGYFGDFGGRYIPETLVEAHRSGSPLVCFVRFLYCTRKWCVLFAVWFGLADASRMFRFIAYAGARIFGAVLVFV